MKQSFDEALLVAERVYHLDVVQAAAVDGDHLVAGVSVSLSVGHYELVRRLNVVRHLMFGPFQSVDEYVHSTGVFVAIGPREKVRAGDTGAVLTATNPHKIIIVSAHQKASVLGE